MRDDYRQWLDLRRDYSERYKGLQVYRVKRIEKFYGDVDQAYAQDRLESVLADFRYTAEDGRRMRPNESRIPFNGVPSKNLHTYKFAIGLYRKFLDAKAGVMPVRLPDEQADDGLDDSSYVAGDDDQRKTVERQIRERRGQQSFRDTMRKRFSDRCVVTGCEVLGLLEAAHINPYRGEMDNNAANGLLLRADIHTLFDLYMLGIQPNKLVVELHPALIEDEYYRNLVGRPLQISTNRRPSIEALKIRYERFQASVAQAKTSPRKE